MQTRRNGWGFLPAGRPAPLAWMAALALVVFLAPPVQSHSLKDVEALLSDREKYFQPLDKPMPDFTLRASDGRIVPAVDLRGKVVVLHFIYTACPDVCPLHAERIAEIQAMVNVSPMKNRVTFVTITTDPDNDTPEVLRNYRADHGLDPVNWLFLTTAPGEPEDTTRKLAKAFGHQFAKGEDGIQAHGVVTHVIDMTGRWRANFHGLEFAPTNLVLFINGLTNANVPHSEPKPPSLWSRFRSIF